MKDTIDVVIGGQFGSESKGLVSAHLSVKKDYNWLVSVNSTQAGHTAPIFETGEFFVNRQLPSSAVNNRHAMIFIGAGAVINTSVLKQEIEDMEKLGIPIKDRLVISPQALVISAEDVMYERNEGFKEKIGSTCEGVGSAISRRAIRKADLYGNREFSSNAKPCGKILLEGSQGFGLSLFSEYYPFCTSRDTTTASFLSYAQLSPRDVRDVYGVYRTFPIRVGGNSGVLKNEMTWEEVAKQAGYENLIEITTVTKRVRRIGAWDKELYENSIKVNGVNKPVLTFVNYIDSRCEGEKSWESLTEEARQWILKNGKSKEVDRFYAVSTSKSTMFEI